MKIYHQVVSVGMVLVLFILSGCATGKLRKENESLKQEVARLTQVEQDYGDKLRETQGLSEQEKRQLEAEMELIEFQLNSRLEDQVQRNEVLIQKVKDLTVIKIGEESLFPSGEAYLTKKGTRVARELAKTLEQFPGFHVTVEGHTDPLPIGKSLKSKYFSNWELSTARATNLVRYLVYGLKMDPSRLSAAGYAQYRPIASNDTKKGRAQNRRIRIVVYKTVETK